MNDTLGSRIRNLRTKKGLSMDDLAKVINSSRQTIYKYENGIVTEIPPSKLQSIANLLGCSPAYLMGWDDIPTDEEVIEMLKPHLKNKEELPTEIEVINSYLKPFGRYIMKSSGEYSLIHEDGGILLSDNDIKTLKIAIENALKFATDTIIDEKSKTLDKNEIRV